MRSAIDLAIRRNHFIAGLIELPRKGPVRSSARPIFSFAPSDPIVAMQRTGSLNFCLDGASLERISAAGLLSKLNSSVPWER